MLNNSKANARAKVGYALATGRLAKRPCEDCGDVDVQAHHEDYSKPLEVKWLCRKDHWKRHTNAPLIGDAVPSLQISGFDDGVYAELQKLPRTTTIKQFCTEAIAEKLGVPVPAQPKRGAPAKEK